MTSTVKREKSKRDRGQFYTTNSSYILEGMPLPPKDVRCVVEPFAGKGDLIDWLRASSDHKMLVESFDIDPKRDDIKRRDTLKHPPSYKNAWIVTNPPYLARNKSENKDIFDLYETNDLYKCFITSVVRQEIRSPDGTGGCRGGIFIIPAGFFFSPRAMDIRCRNDFMTKYRIVRVRYFEQSVFDDTSTTVVAIAFEQSDVDLKEQEVLWEHLPSKVEKTFRMSSESGWIIGGEIYTLSVPKGVSVRRHVEGNKLKENEQQTFMTLNALDSGTAKGRISLEYKNDYIYPAKECSRTYATLRITGRKLSEKEQIKLCSEFNAFLEEKRKETWSLFLPILRTSS